MFCAPETGCMASTHRALGEAASAAGSHGLRWPISKRHRSFLQKEGRAFPDSDEGNRHPSADQDRGIEFLFSVLDGHVDGTLGHGLWVRRAQAGTTLPSVPARLGYQGGAVRAAMRPAISSASAAPMGFARPSRNQRPVSAALAQAFDGLGDGGTSTGRGGTDPRSPPHCPAVGTFAPPRRVGSAWHYQGWTMHSAPSKAGRA